MAEIVLERNYYYPGIFVARIVNAIIGVIELALAVRIILELFGASASSAFVAWVYAVTNGLIGPFVGAFPGLSLGGNSVIDIVGILAMIVYAFLGWLIIQVLSYIFVSAVNEY